MNKISAVFIFVILSGQAILFIEHSMMQEQDVLNKIPRSRGTSAINSECINMPGENIYKSDPPVDWLYKPSDICTINNNGTKNTMRTKSE